MHKQGYSVKQDTRRRRSRKPRMHSVHTSRRSLLRFSARTLLLVLLAGVFVVSAGLLLDYAIDYFRAKKAANDLREIYYAATDTPAPTVHVTATPQSVTAMPVTTPVPAITPIPQDPSLLPTVYYPGNASARVSSRFSTLQRQNKDIIGWLRIDEMLDEPVVQRDNSYYLRRDYRGYHNTNGSIFLDENCNLQTRPYTLLLYGHNMKTGAMFGALRNYENITYYKNNPFVTFDSAYEDGRYVIFSVAMVSTQARDRHFLDFIKLRSNSIDWRKGVIEKLQSLSIFSSAVDVRPDDQLLLLVTCVDDEEDRRVVAARRLRPGESEIKLQEQISKSRKK